MPLEVRPLRHELARRAQRDVARRPDLAVRVRVAAPHHRALVLEDLDVPDRPAPRRASRLPGRPRVDDAAGSPRRPSRRASGRGGARSRPPGSVPWRARPRGGRPSSTGAMALSGSSAAKSLSKAKVAVYGRVALAARAEVARAQVARGVVPGPALGGLVLDLPLPGPLAAGGASTAPTRRGAGCSGGGASSGGRSSRCLGRAPRLDGLARSCHRADAPGVACGPNPSGRNWLPPVEEPREPRGRRSARAVVRVPLHDLWEPVRGPSPRRPGT